MLSLQQSNLSLIYIDLCADTTRYIVTLVSLIYDHNQTVVLELRNIAPRAICDVEEEVLVADASCPTTQWMNMCRKRVRSLGGPRVCLGVAPASTTTELLLCHGVRSRP